MTIEVKPEDVRSAIGGDAVSPSVLKEEFTASDYETAIATGEDGVTIEFVGW